MSQQPASPLPHTYLHQRNLRRDSHFHQTHGLIVSCPQWLYCCRCSLDFHWFNAEDPFMVYAHDDADLTQHALTGLEQVCSGPLGLTVTFEGPLG
jgi:hypothetical protein